MIVNYDSIKDTMDTIRAISLFENVTVEFNNINCRDNQAACGGRDIYFGKYYRADLLMAAFFHEIGHTKGRLKWEEGITKQDMEADAWKASLESMKKYGIPLTHEMAEYMIECITSYQNYEMREYSRDGFVNQEIDLILDRHGYNSEKLPSYLIDTDTEVN